MTKSLKRTTKKKNLCICWNLDLTNNKTKSKSLKSAWKKNQSFQRICSAFFLLGHRKFFTFQFISRYLSALDKIPIHCIGDLHVFSFWNQFVQVKVLFVESSNRKLLLVRKRRKIHDRIWCLIYPFWALAFQKAIKIWLF